MHSKKSSPLKPSYLNPPSSIVRGGFLLCLVIGVIAVGAGFFSQPERTWGALLFNFFFFFTLSVCAMAFSAMQEIIAVEWARPIKRIHESFGVFIPYASLFFIFFSDRYFSWFFKC